MKTADLVNGRETNSNLFLKTGGMAVWSPPEKNNGWVVDGEV
jgi:hypothetical protein